ncbi:sensor histidine kinase [Gordoniibacillus kamchatkensis]|uniref:sensor histidine kinase n=1 Tax=Gordoniibacillus kamchatkensis TaxID=1590651 RepID=UPI001E30A242|nr:histidine kinase [Paenibacillus sp. VKM B-2647]
MGRLAQQGAAGIGRYGGLGSFPRRSQFNVITGILSSISLGKRGYVFIVDNDGNLVYHPQQQLIYSNLKTELIDRVLASGKGSFRTNEGGQSRIYTVERSDFGWYIVGVSYVDELIGDKTRMRLSFLLWGAVCLAVAFTMSVLLSRRLSRPILQLQEHMKEVEKGNFDIQVPVEKTKEIGRLAKTFNLMVGRIKDLMDQVVKEQEFKRRTELSALQAQINPHFLYNTLDSIIWMAESKRSEEVVLMTSALAKLFRASISIGEELVPVRNELEHIAGYLTIQKIRYRDKLEFRIDTDPGILNCKTLKIVLQPIVENAIYHGIKNMYGVGVITITGEKRDGDVVLRVADNGVGMEPEQVKRLLVPRSTSGDSGKGKGFGLLNVHERIKLVFGPAYGLTIESEPDEGTTVTVRMPAIGADGKKEGDGG